MIILKWVLERWGVIECIELVQDRDRWRDLMITVMTLQVP
jgi:hypothetical protein